MKKSLLLIAMFAIVFNGFSQIKAAPETTKGSPYIENTRTPTTTLRYCSDTRQYNLGYGGANFFHIMMLMPEDTMTKYAGGNITIINVNIGPDNLDDLTIKIWTDTSDFGANPAYEQVVDLADMSDGWNQITLTTPFAITGDSLFIGYSCNSIDYGLGMDDKAVDERGLGGIIYDGSGWGTTKDFGAPYDYNWMITAVVDDGNPYIDFALDLQTGNEYTMIPVFMQRKMDFSVKATNKGNKNAPAGQVITVTDSHADGYTATATTTVDLINGETDSIGFDTQFFPALGAHTLTFTTTDDYDAENSTVVFSMEITDTVMACDSRTDEKTGTLSSFHYSTLELWFGNAFEMNTDADLTSVTFYCDAPTQDSTVLRVYRLGADTIMIAQSDSIGIKSANEIKRTVIFPADSIADDYYKNGGLYLTKDANYLFVLYQTGSTDLNLESSEANKSGALVAPAFGIYNTSKAASVLRLNFGTHVGINTVVNNTNVKLYPNPTTGIINISEKASVSIYSIAGVKLADYNEVNTFDMSNLAKGAYIVKIKTNNTIVTKKVTLTK